MASRSVAARPTRARRWSSSRSEKPQSMRTRDTATPSSASTTVALPVLPLPRLQKRTGETRGRVRGLLQVFDEQAHDPLAGLAGLGAALRIEHRDGAAGVALALDRDAVARQRRGLVLLAAEAEEPR